MSQWVLEKTNQYIPSKRSFTLLHVNAFWGVNNEFLTYCTSKYALKAVGRHVTCIAMD